MEALPSPDLGPIEVPEHLSENAKNVWQEYVDSFPSIKGTDLVALLTACEMLTQVDELQTASREHGVVSRNKLGEIVVSSLITEMRFQRQAAMQILQRLNPDADAAETAYQKKSRAGSAGNRARWGN